MASSTTEQLTILLMPGVSAGAADLISRIGGQVTVRTAETIEGAFEQMRSGSIDVVIVDPIHLMSREPFSVPTGTESMLEQATEGNCIVDQGGALLWANPRMLGFPEQLRDRVIALCVEAFRLVTGAGSGAVDQAPPPLRGRRHTVQLEGHTYEVHVTPIKELNKEATHVAAVVWDATRLKTLQEKIDAIDKAAEELVSLDAEHIDRLDTQQRLDLLEQKVIRYTRELMHFDNFTVHLLDKKTNKLELVLSSGMPSKVHEIPIYARAQGNGVCGYVAATGRSYICPDVEHDDRYIPGIEGAKSCLTVPLRLHDRVIGVFNVESRQLAAFSEDDRQFAEIFARHIAMALHILDLMVSERHRTTGQLASDVAAEITGPLNDILTDVANLLDDYIGHDELRHRLNQISDNGVRIRDALRQVTSRQPGLIGRHRGSSSVRHDPVLKDRRILVVDDEDVIRETVCDVLRSYGCKVEAAADGDTGIELISKHDFDLVLSDIKMPAHSGYELFAAAKDRNRDCPVILMTGFGYDPNHSIIRARREGLAAVLFKPFKVEQLLGEIRTAIRSASMG